MHSDERRKAIADVLRAADAPVSASALAEKFSVSRQIIVGDIALLRSSGEEILATPRGYVTPKEARGILRRVAVKHTPQEMEAELNAIVDNGCTVIDVTSTTPSTASSPARCKFRTATRSASSLSAAKGGAAVQSHRRHPPAHALLSRRGGVRAHEECAARTARPAGGKRKLRVDNPHTSEYSVMCTCQDTCT